MTVCFYFLKAVLLKLLGGLDVRCGPNGDGLVARAQQSGQRCKINAIYI